jgi:hypothetical protein
VFAFGVLMIAGVEAVGMQYFKMPYLVYAFLFQEGASEVMSVVILADPTALEGLCRSKLPFYNLRKTVS